MATQTCPYFVPLNRPPALFACNAEELFGNVTLPTVEERLDFCTTGRFSACPVYRWLVVNPERIHDIPEVE